MRYAVLNAVRVFISYAVMLVFAAWAYQRHFHFRAAAMISLLYVFAFVPLPKAHLWKRLLYITLAAVPLMIVPILHSVIFFGGARSLNFFWEEVEILFLVGLLGPHYIVFLLTYIALEFLIIRKFLDTDRNRVELPNLQDGARDMNSTRSC